MSEIAPTPNPLPTRFTEVSEKRKLLEEGIVLQVEGYQNSEFNDISNACQAIIIERLNTDLVANFNRPKLTEEKPFYVAFGVGYYDAVVNQEEHHWKSLVQEVVDSNFAANKLTDLQAATLTLASMSGFEHIAASSRELFVELALHAEVYQKLLREKLREEYTDDIFFILLQQHIPNLLKRLIAMDSVIIDYYRANMMDRSGFENPDEAEYISSPLNVKFFDLDDNLKLSINPKTIEFFKRHAKYKNIKSDSVGRVENRGCPFLKTTNQDVIIGFAIQELIEQYRNRKL